MSTTYKFNRDGVEEEVERELYAWKVIYRNGETLSQFADDGVFHQFKDIVQDEPLIFQMLDLKDRIVASLLFVPERMGKLIHFYKRYHLEVGSENERKVTLYVYGYENDNGKVLNVITPSGEVITADDLNGLQVS